MRAIPALPTTPVDLVTAGEAFEDLVFYGLTRLPRRGEELKTRSFVRAAGGGAVITAVAAARLGLRTRLLAAPSDYVLGTLSAAGVEVVNLRGAAEPDAITVSLSTRDERTFVTYDGANDGLEERLLAAVGRVRHARHVHLALMPASCRRWRTLLLALHRRGMTTSWSFGHSTALARDPAFAGLCSELDYLFVNEAEAMRYARRRTAKTTAAYWRTVGPNVIITRGRSGARWVCPAHDLSVKPEGARSVDTTGAGDAFVGGFLYGVLRSETPLDCLRIASRVAAAAISKPGGIDGLPRSP